MEIVPISFAPEYGISSDGRVWSRLKTGGKRGKGVSILLDGWHEHGKHLDGSGYLRTTLYTGNARKRITAKVHRLVAFAFLGNPEFDSMEVNHKNFDKTDNRAENLEWVSRAENSTHFHSQFNVAPRGENHPLAKLTYDIADKIRDEYSNGHTSLNKIAAKYGVSKKTILNIIHNKIWIRDERISKRR